MFESKKESKSIRFDPPLYRQRYNFVHKTLDDPKWCQDMKKVVEFGCAGMDLIKFLKPLETISSILQVDCDDSLLKENSFKAQPLNQDYMSQRESTLDIKILHGSICDPDYRLIGSDAVVCIEVIEHLNPGTLDRVPKNIFGYIEPKIAIFTTPNAEFNILFPRLKSGSFRHDDHRFEWTRRQFQDWANNVIQQYPKYQVQFHGLGQGPEGTQQLGCCSQAAVFINMEYVRKDAIDVNQNKIDVSNKSISEQIDLLTHKYINTYLSEGVETENCLWDNVNWDQPNADFYKLINEYNYPFTVNKRSPNEKILDEVKFKMYLYKEYNQSEDCNDQMLIPIQRLLPTSEKLIIDLENLRQLLSSEGYAIVDDNVVYDLKKDYDDRSQEDEEMLSNQPIDPWSVNNDCVDEVWGEDNWENCSTDKSIKWV